MRLFSLSFAERVENIVKAIDELRDEMVDELTEVERQAKEIRAANDALGVYLRQRS